MSMLLVRDMNAKEDIWQRPVSVPVPTVWSRYESPKPMPNGVRPRFRIQDFSEEYREAVLYNMTKYFLRDEPLSSSLNVSDCPKTVDVFARYINEYLNRKMALIAVVENLNELGDESLPALAGCNITAVIKSTEKEDLKAESEKVELILSSLEILKKMNNPYQYYGVNEYLYAMGLSVDPLYRGHNLGYEILKARFPICKAVGIPVSVTAFTAAAAQKAAERLGYQVLSEIRYDEHKNDKGEIIFKIGSPKSMKMMGVRI